MVEHAVADSEVLKPARELKPYSVGRSKLFYMLQVEVGNEKKVPLKYKVNKSPVHYISVRDKLGLLDDNKDLRSRMVNEKVGLYECFKKGYLRYWLEIVNGGVEVKKCVYNFDSYG